MPPQSPDSKKENRSLYLSVKMWDDLDAIATEIGLTPAEVYRQCMELGIIAKKEQLARALTYQTKSEVLRKLKQRQGEMEAVIDELGQSANGTQAALIEKLRGFLKD